MCDNRHSNVTLTCAFCHTRAFSLKRSQPVCQVVFFYKPWQQKTDHRASSCHTSILPRASEDRLQHALTFPGATSKQIFCSFPVFLLFCLAVGVNQWEASTWRCDCVYIQRCTCSNDFFYSFLFYDTVPSVQCLHFPCATESLFAYFCGTLSVWWCLRWSVRRFFVFWKCL